jgi:hypothetical protein
MAVSDDGDEEEEEQEGGDTNVFNGLRRMGRGYSARARWSFLIGELFGLDGSGIQYDTNHEFWRRTAMA